MRVSPVAWAAESLSQCLALAKASAEVTHNHPDGIAGACVVAGAVYLARVGGEQGGHRRPRHPVLPPGLHLDEIREDYAFDVTCASGIPPWRPSWEAEGFGPSGAPSPSAGTATPSPPWPGRWPPLYGIPGTSGTRPWPTWTGEVYTIYDQFSRQY